MRAYCKIHGLVVEKVFSDVAKSAKSTKGRDHFNAMIDAITADSHPAGVLIYSLSRFSRNFDDRHTSKRTCEDMESLFIPSQRESPKASRAGLSKLFTINQIRIILSKIQKRSNARLRSTSATDTPQADSHPKGTAPKKLPSEKREMDHCAQLADGFPIPNFSRWYKSPGECALKANPTRRSQKQPAGKFINR